MSSFRGIGSGQYVVARIFKFGDTYHLLEISGVLPSSRRDDALRYTVAKIIQNPELVYLDNPEKQKEIEEDVEDIYKKFTEFFGTTEIVTTNKNADELIGIFNDYAEEGNKADFQHLIVEPEEYKFFSVSEFNNSYDNFLENSLGGFSSHHETYDVGIIYDKELGLYAIPFYGTFNKIFEVKDYTKIVNYDECIKYFLKNDKYSANLIKMVAEKHKNFMEIVNAVLGKNYTLEDVLKKYKRRYLNNKIMSSTTVLYRSNAFSNTLGIIEEDENKPEIDLTKKIGRNDPCPCGSGKKFKKCCGANL
jgi:ribosomal protein L10